MSRYYYMMCAAFEQDRNALKVKVPFAKTEKAKTKLLIKIEEYNQAILDLYIKDITQQIRNKQEVLDKRVNRLKIKESKL